MALTFCKVIQFCMRSEAHVLLSRETVTVESLGPWATLAGEHGSTAVPHCHTQTTTGLDKPERGRRKTNVNDIVMTGTMCFRNNLNVEKTREHPYVSRQTGAIREQRKAWAWGWQPVCNKGFQSSDRGTTSRSKLLWPKKLGRRISEYPTSLQTFIWLGMATQRVDWPMSNATAECTKTRRLAAKINAMMTI